MDSIINRIWSALRRTWSSILDPSSSRSRSSSPLPPYIYGLHEPGGEYLMEEAGTPGWIVFTEELGHDASVQTGHDYRPWSDRGFGIIARLNHGYGSAGTIPLLMHYEAFAQRVANFVEHSPGCHVWIIGNEMNHIQERPERTDGSSAPLLPYSYSVCFVLCQQAIHALPGHQDDQIVPGAVAPWNAETPYTDNPTGDWLQYFVDVLNHIQTLRGKVGALALHAYTHGPEPALITDESKMKPPFEDRLFNFRAYRDFLAVVPDHLRHLPVYVTETNQNQPWVDENNGWVQEAYKEIDSWNKMPDTQTILALCLYRWPKYDGYFLKGKTGVHDDFRAAMEHRYKWTSEDDNGGAKVAKLKNPGFEEPYTERGAREVRVAQHWTPFYSTGLPPQEHSQGPCVRPEYKPLTPEIDPYRILEGQRSQCFFVTEAVMDAGVYQVIEGLPVGKPIEFAIHAHAWCSNSDNPRISEREMYLSLGLDLDGGIDPWSLSINWIQWVPLNAIFQRTVTSGITRGPTVTLWVRLWNKWKSEHADGYLDKAEFTVKEDTPPQPPPGEWTEDKIRDLAKEEAQTEFKSMIGDLRLTIPD